MAKSNFARHALILLFALGTATLIWAGDKPWNKPYQSWDAKDIKQVMTDSPWVATTSARRSWHPSPNATMVQPVQPEIAGGVRTGPSVVGTVASNTGGNEPTDQVHIYAYWYSSRLIRAASARQAVLGGMMDQQAAEKLVDAPQAEYEIVFRMDDMTPFLDKDANYYQQNAFLEMRRSKAKLPASKVVYEHMGTTSEAVVFSFPRKSSDGSPTIANDETDVVFSCKIADQTVRVDFKPKKMVDQFGPDL